MAGKRSRKVKRKKGTKKKVTRRKVTKRKVTKRKVAPRRRTKGKTSSRKVTSKQKVSMDVIGKIVHYFPHVKAGVLKVTKGSVSLGDVIHIKGHTTDFKQKINSLQLDRVSIQKAGKGQEVGIQVKSRVRQNDVVYRFS